ncbi:MAG TPA: hypothetical protein VNW54_14020 [Granulicella sp.]|jgi:hypothetical protein|nr:hypothetical protein [Granulicella sp.]
MARMVYLGMWLALAGGLIGERGVRAQSSAGAGSERIAAVKGTSGAPGNVAAGPQTGTAGNPQTGPSGSAQTERQKTLAMETEKLVAMATELKVRVDKTNKDILSLRVVEQAKAIEEYAHQLKQEEPKK